MAKNLEVTIQGKDRSGAALKGLGKNLRSAKGATSSLLAKMSQLTIVGLGVTRTMRTLGRALSKTFDASEKQELAEIRLAVALKNTGQEVTKNLKGLKEWAAQRQAVTTFGDEWTLQMAALGTTMGKLADEDLKRAIRAVQDYASVGKDGEAMMLLLSRAAAGGTADFSRYGLVVDANLKGMDKFNAAVRQLESGFGGMSETVAKAGSGKFKQLANVWGDLQEAIGSVITSSTSFQKLMGFLKDVVSSMTGEIGGNDAAVRKWAAAFDSVFEVVVSLALDAIPALFQTLSLAMNGFASSMQTFRKAQTWAQQAVEDTTGKILPHQKVIHQLEADIRRLSSDVVAIQKYGEAWDGQLGKVNRALQESIKNLRVQRGEIAMFEIPDMGDLVQKVNDFRESWKNATPEIRTAKDAIDEIAQSAQSAGPGGGGSFFSGLLAGAESIGPKLSAAIGSGFTASSEAVSGFWGSFLDASAKYAEDQEFARRALENQLAQFEALGAEYGSVFQQAMIEGFDPSMGFSEAFKNAGSNARDAFVGQMSGAAFDPLKESFGELARAMAQPFNIVGKAIKKAILDPIVNVLAKVFSQIATWLGEQLGLIASNEAASLGAIKATTAAMLPLASINAGAAVAAAIASFGAANAFGPIAQAQIVTAKALGAVPAEEGGIFLHQPGTGGTLVNLAEREPEVVAPLGDLEKMFGGGGGQTFNIAVYGDGFGDETSLIERIQDGILEAMEGRLRGGLS